MGKTLRVNLSTGEMGDEALDEELCRLYVSGCGLGAKIIFDRMAVDTDPLGPDAIFGLARGLFDATQDLGGPRHAAVGKSPLTGGWGDTNSGGNFGPYPKHAGYDAVFFTGISRKRLHLLIDSGRAKLRDVSSVWGTDTFDTEDILKAVHGGGTEAARIGPAGEKVALITAITHNKSRAAGRSGLGAVGASKRPKAAVAKGNLGVPRLDEQKVRKLRRKTQAGPGDHIGLLRVFGTSCIFNVLAEAGDTSTKDRSSTAVVDVPNFKDVGASPAIDRKSGKHVRYRCPIGCGGHMKESVGDIIVDKDALNLEYMAAMGWDLVTARPWRETLLKLGMEGVARVLRPWGTWEQTRRRNLAARPGTSRRPAAKKQYFRVSANVITCVI